MQSYISFIRTPSQRCHTDSAELHWHAGQFPFLDHTLSESRSSPKSSVGLPVPVSIHVQNSIPKEVVGGVWLSHNRCRVSGIQAGRKVIVTLWNPEQQDYSKAQLGLWSRLVSRFRAPSIYTVRMPGTEFVWWG